MRIVYTKKGCPQPIGLLWPKEKNQVLMASYCHIFKLLQIIDSDMTNIKLMFLADEPFVC
jgi:hypothetical protein